MQMTGYVCLSVTYRLISRPILLARSLTQYLSAADESGLCMLFLILHFCPRATFPAHLQVCPDRRHPRRGLRRGAPPHPRVAVRPEEVARETRADGALRIRNGA